MPKFAAGGVRFQNDAYPHKAQLLEKLSEGQSPEALLVTCSTSHQMACLTASDLCAA